MHVGAAHLFFWYRLSCWDLGSVIRLDWLVQETQDLPVSAFPALGLQEHVPPHATFYMDAGYYNKALYQPNLS